MNTNLIQQTDYTILLKLVNNHAINHQSGLPNVPHLCLKIEHGKGFSWYGMQIISHNKEVEWTPERMDQMQEELVQALYQMTDVKAIVTRMDRLMLSIKDLLENRRKPIIFGGDSDVFLQTHLDWNVRLDVFRGEVSEEVRTYGGFEIQINDEGRMHKGFLYHRGVPLNNYITGEKAAEITEVALMTDFPEHYSSKLGLFVDVIAVVERHRPVNKVPSNEVPADSH